MAIHDERRTKLLKTHLLAFFVKTMALVKIEFR